MASRRWALDRLLAWWGGSLVLVVFLSLGVHVASNVSRREEQALERRGRMLANVLAHEIVDAVLVDDRLALDDALQRARVADPDIHYLCVRDARGEVLAHTFHGGVPVALNGLWSHRGSSASFRTHEGPLMDVAEPVLTSELGFLHVGLSRQSVVAEARRLMWMMAGMLVAGSLILLGGTRFVARMVSQPLRQLELQVSKLPQQNADPSLMQVSGTYEVESLSRGFVDMLKRLAALERERAASQERIIQAERLAALGEMAAGLAHEIHNPLDGMLECVRFLEADPQKSERAAKYYPMLQEGLGRIARVMRQMLTFASSGHDIPLEPYPTAGIMRSLQLLVEKQLEGRNVEVAWQYPGGCLCTCNRHALTQAALNLVLNAAEAAEERPRPQVLVAATCDEEWVYLAVEDSGPGVREDMRERVFDAFITTKPTTKGTGLGLPVSRQLVRAVGGDVELAEELGSLGGARFVIRLPKVPDTECEHGGPTRPDSDC